LEHPFYVVERGWSSCSPDRTMSRYGLPCHRLTVGDRCISLTPRLDDTDTKLTRTPTSGMGMTSTVFVGASSMTARQDIVGVPRSIERSSLQGHVPRGTMCSDTAATAAVRASRPVDYSRVTWSDRTVRSSQENVHYESTSSTAKMSEGRIIPVVDAAQLPVVQSGTLDIRRRSAPTGRKRRHSDSDAQCASVPPPSGDADCDERVDERRS